ncbi:MAG: sugar nucleotide-binding protein, partial [Candidatus Kapaibacteriota bacterium]
MKKIAIIGATGIVGEATLELILQESDSSTEVVAFSNNELQVNFEKLEKSYAFSLLNFKLLRKRVLDEKPNVIINAVGISDLDYCEKNKQKAWQVNVTLVEHLVSLAKILNAKFITFSCEHIFNGLSGPYSEN